MGTGEGDGVNFRATTQRVVPDMGPSPGTEQGREEDAMSTSAACAEDGGSPWSRMPAPGRAIATAWLGLSLFSPSGPRSRLAGRPCRRRIWSKRHWVRRATAAADFARWSHEVLTRRPICRRPTGWPDRCRWAAAGSRPRRRRSSWRPTRTTRSICGLREVRRQARGPVPARPMVAERRLTEQARAHFTRVIQLEPNNKAALRSARLQTVGEKWCTAADIQRQNRLKSEYARVDAQGEEHS